MGCSVRRLVAAVALVLVAGCASDEPSTVGSRATESPTPSPTPTAAYVAPALLLEGLGATYTSFREGHQINDDDCGGLCFDGTVRDADGTEQAKAVLIAGSQDGLVLNITVHFPAGVTLDQARLEAKEYFAYDSPQPEATLRDPRCLVEVYRSQTTESAVGPATSGEPFTPAVSYYSGPGNFTASTIDKAIVHLHELHDTAANC